MNTKLSRVLVHTPASIALAPMLPSASLPGPGKEPCWPWGITSPSRPLSLPSGVICSGTSETRAALGCSVLGCGRLGPFFPGPGQVWPLNHFLPPATKGIFHHAYWQVRLLGLLSLWLYLTLPSHEDEPQDVSVIFM